jgi:MBG domain (YGX type)
LTVNRATLTVTANDAAKTYDGLAFSGGNGVAYGGFVNHETAGVLGGTLTYGGTAQNAVNAGSYTLTAGGLTSGNYTINYTAGALTVNRATLTVAANDAAKTYDGQAFNGGNGVTYNGFVHGDTSAALGGTLTYGGNAQNAVNAGSYILTAGGLTSGNYTIGYVDGGLTVTPRAITVTADAQSRVYGDSNPALAYNIGGAGLVNNDTLIGGLATSATPASNVGSYAIAQNTLSASANYVLTYIGANLRVTPRPITVSADPQSRGFVDANPLLTYQVGGRGLVNGDTLSGTLATSAMTNSDPGDYAITQNTVINANNANYAIAYVGANLTVKPPPTGSVTSILAQSRSSTTTTRDTPITIQLNTGTPPAITALPGPRLARVAATPGGDLTGSIGDALKSADGNIYLPISQYDAHQYGGATLPGYQDRAGAAAVFTMLARGLMHAVDGIPTIDNLFDAAKGIADWNGVGWSNPAVAKGTLSDGAGHAATPDAPFPLQAGKTDLGALLAKGPVLIGSAPDGNGNVSWLLAIAISGQGIVANDPITGQRVLLAYNAETRTVGGIGGVYDAQAKKWLGLGDADHAALERDLHIISADAARLSGFAAVNYIAVAAVK